MRPDFREPRQQDDSDGFTIGLRQDLIQGGSSQLHISAQQCAQDSTSASTMSTAYSAM